MLWAALSLSNGRRGLAVGPAAPASIAEIGT
jgi:hypothetical protein